MELATDALDVLIADFPELSPLSDGIARAAATTVSSLWEGGFLYLCGNGGSFADALHIAGELKKSFEKPRPLPMDLQNRLKCEENGADLAHHLHSGLRAVVLGADPVLATAVGNDIGISHAVFAQELVALGRAGDVLFAISTSGRARNVLNAVSVARSLAMPVIALTGNAESPLSNAADVALRAPAEQTASVQSWHSQIYHAYCRVIEDTIFDAR